MRERQIIRVFKINTSCLKRRESCVEDLKGEKMWSESFIWNKTDIWVYRAQTSCHWHKNPKNVDPEERTRKEAPENQNNSNHIEEGTSKSSNGHTVTGRTKVKKKWRKNGEVTHKISL